MGRNKMDGGGLNGSMMDPMKMSDAELLEVPPAPPVSEEVNVDKSGEIKIMEDKMKALEEDRTTKMTEIDKQSKEILSLREAATRLTKENADLKEKIELNEDELTDLREQFVEMEKEADQSAIREKEYQSEKAKVLDKLKSQEKDNIKLAEGQK